MNGQVTEWHTYRSQKPSSVGSTPTLATINIQMNFTALYEQKMYALIVEKNYGTIPNPPIDVVLSKRATKDLKKDPMLRANFIKRMKNWENLRRDRMWEKLAASSRLNDKFNLPRNITAVALDLGGAHWYRAIGYIDDNNVYQIFSIMTHEAFNKIAVS